MPRQGSSRPINVAHLLPNVAFDVVWDFSGKRGSASAVGSHTGGDTPLLRGDTTSPPWAGGSLYGRARTHTRRVECERRESLSARRRDSLIETTRTSTERRPHLASLGTGSDPDPAIVLLTVSEPSVW